MPYQFRTCRPAAPQLELPSYVPLQPSRIYYFGSKTTIHYNRPRPLLRLFFFLHPHVTTSSRRIDSQPRSFLRPQAALTKTKKNRRGTSAYVAAPRRVTLYLQGVHETQTIPMGVDMPAPVDPLAPEAVETRNRSENLVGPSGVAGGMPGHSDWPRPPCAGSEEGGLGRRLQPQASSGDAGVERSVASCQSSAMKSHGVTPSHREEGIMGGLVDGLAGSPSAGPGQPLPRQECINQHDDGQDVRGGDQTKGAHDDTHSSGEASKGNDTGGGQGSPQQGDGPRRVSRDGSGDGSGGGGGGGGDDQWGGEHKDVRARLLQLGAGTGEELETIIVTEEDMPARELQQVVIWKVNARVRALTAAAAAGTTDTAAVATTTNIGAGVAGMAAATEPVAGATGAAAAIALAGDADTAARGAAMAAAATPSAGPHAGSNRNPDADSLAAPAPVPQPTPPPLSQGVVFSISREIPSLLPDSREVLAFHGRKTAERLREHMGAICDELVSRWGPDQIGGITLMARTGRVPAGSVGFFFGVHAATPRVAEQAGELVMGHQADINSDTMVSVRVPPPAEDPR
eukprot:jgi/Mesvir1/13170/Mv06134-RA.1